MCYNSEHKRIQEHIDMGNEMRLSFIPDPTTLEGYTYTKEGIESTDNLFHDLMVLKQEQISLLYGRWQDAIREAKKDRHPQTNEPLDGE